MNKTIKILLAEDEPSLGQIIKESLETRNFEVLLCENGAVALQILLCENGAVALQKYEEEKPELLVLDVMMPLKDGFTLAEEIREHNAEIPIIFLTAKSQVKDVVEGFEIGGNDYLKKPFSMEELIVRINALLKRNKIGTETLNIGKFIFNLKKQTLQMNSTVETLTHREAHLLYHLIKNKNQVLERSFILKKLWGDDDFFSARSMDVFITKLRKKIKKDPAIQIINVRGYGYKLIF
jgi:DNA-binding response OmpR family regulator